MKLRKENGHLLLILEKEEDLVKSLTDILVSEGIEGGNIQGIGAVKNITLGFFDTERKEYSKKTFNGFYELASLKGNISQVDGKLFCHMHAVISDSEMHTFAGHLFEAVISVTGEILITPGKKTIRKHDNETGLNLIEL